MYKTFLSVLEFVEIVLIVTFKLGFRVVNNVVHVIVKIESLYIMRPIHEAPFPKLYFSG